MLLNPAKKPSQQYFLQNLIIIFLLPLFQYVWGKHALPVFYFQTSLLGIISESFLALALTHILIKITRPVLAGFNKVKIRTTFTIYQHSFYSLFNCA